MYQARSDAPLRWITGIAATVGGSLMVLIFGFLIWQSYPAISEIGLMRLLEDPQWHPTAETPQFGAWPMMIASGLVTLGAVAWALPTGVAVAVTIEFYAPKLAAVALTRVIELLAGVPSVVFGLWGLISLVPLISQYDPPGQCLLAGVLVLGLMVVPTIVLTAIAAIQSTPSHFRSSAVALGLGRFRMVRSLVLPSAMRGIFGGAILAATRAVGETMAVLMVCGNIVQMPSSIFDPVRTVTANIALEMGDDTAFHRSILFLTGLLLMAGITLLMFIAEPFRRRSRNAY